jgi:hypothetical protein
VSLRPSSILSHDTMTPVALAGLRMKIAASCAFAVSLLLLLGWVFRSPHGQNLVQKLGRQTTVRNDGDLRNVHNATLGVCLERTSSILNHD